MKTNEYVDCYNASSNILIQIKNRCIHIITVTYNHRFQLVSLKGLQRPKVKIEIIYCKTQQAICKGTFNQSNLKNKVYPVYFNLKPG